MRALGSLLAAALLAFPSAANAASFDIDGAHTSAVFSVSHLGYSYTYGMFRKCSGAVEFDKADPAAAAFTFEIDVTSIDTANDQRDSHLLNADFFNAEKFEKITFQSDKVEPAGDRDGKPLYQVTGKLTMLGVTKEVTLPMQLLGEGETPFNDYRIGFLCQTTLKRSDFGMTGSLGPIGDSVGVTVSFEGVRK